VETQAGEARKMAAKIKREARQKQFEEQIENEMAPIKAEHDEPLRREWEEILEIRKSINQIQKEEARLDWRTQERLDAENERRLKEVPEYVQLVQRRTALAKREHELLDEGSTRSKVRIHRLNAITIKVTGRVPEKPREEESGFPEGSWEGYD
jgi:hypothetical protein